MRMKHAAAILALTVGGTALLSALPKAEELIRAREGNEKNYCADNDPTIQRSNQRKCFGLKSVLMFFGDWSELNNIQFVKE